MDGWCWVLLCLLFKLFGFDLCLVWLVCDDEIVVWLWLWLVFGIGWVSYLL